MPTPAISRRTVATWLPLALFGCATRLGADAGPADALLLVDRPVLHLAASTRPAIDAFFARQRADPRDPVTNAWIAAVLAPAERVLSDTFLEPVRFAREILPDEGRVRLEFRQAGPRSARAGEPGYAAFRPLIDGAAPREIRWTIVALATLGQQPDDGIRHDTAIDLLLEQRRDGDARFTNAAASIRPEAVQEFSLALFAAIDDATATWFREACGLEVLRRSA